MKWQKTLIFPLMAMTFLVSGCSMFSGIFSSADEEPAELVQFTPKTQIKELWHEDVGSSENYVFEPAVLNQTVFAAGESGSLYRLDNGSKTWRVKLKKELSAGVGANDNIAVVVTQGGGVYAYDVNNGSQKWKHKLNMEAIAPPTVSDNLVLVRTTDNRLVALDEYSGEQRWVFQPNTTPLSLRSFAPVSVDQNIGLMGLSGGKFVAINLANGGEMMRMSVDLPRGVTDIERLRDIVGPVLLGNPLCAASYQGRIVCFDIRNGDPVWEKNLSSTVGMDRDDDMIYVSASNNDVVALDVHTGQERWRQTALQRRNISRPLAMGSYVIVGDIEGYVHVMDKYSGEFVARVRADSDPIVAHPAKVSDNQFVVQSTGGEIYAFEVN